jgi:hypothetical protein
MDIQLCMYLVNFHKLSSAHSSHIFSAHDSSPDHQMAGAVPTDPWIVDFTPDGPQFSAPSTGGFTVFKVPKHFLEKSPACDYFKIEMLQLGLQNRTLAPDTPEKDFQNLKLEIASVLHQRLSNSPAPLASRSTIKSWDQFAKTVVENADIARSYFQEPTDDEDNPRMSDDAVQKHLALDALFIVFYFQYLNTAPYTFNIKEFDTVAKDRGATLKSLGLENQVPMYLLKRVVQELCKIDDVLSTKLAEFPRHQEPFEALVERELNNLLVIAVLNLLPTSEPTVVRPIPDPLAPTNILTSAVMWMRACMVQSHGRWRGKRFPGELLVEYLSLYYPPHLPHALENCKHILDCVYRVVCGHVQPPCEWDREQLVNPFLESIPSATQLEEVGIKAEASTQCFGNSVELTCGYLTWICSARLKLPKVEILDQTALAFHNLAIYEQFLGQDVVQHNSDLRCYLVCMHQLCRDAADLRLLSKRGVTNVHVKDEVAVGMWGSILEGVERPIPSDAWKKCYENVHMHCHSRWKPWRRRQFGMFLSQPWQKLSILAAIILLVLTALQTWFTVVNSASSKGRWPPRT